MTYIFWCIIECLGHSFNSKNEKFIW